MPEHIFVKTLEEAQRLAPKAKLVKDSSGSDIPCHPYAVCLCDGTPGRIVEHDRKAEITRLIRGDYFWLLLGDGPEAMEAREKYGLKVRTEPIEVRLSPSMTTDDLLGLSGRSKISYIDPFAFNPVGGDDIGAAFPLGGWPGRPRMAMSGRPLVLRSDDPLAEELKRLSGLGKESAETSIPDVPPVGTPKDRFLDFLRHTAASMDPSLPVDDFYVEGLADHMDALAQVDAPGERSELQILKAQQNDPNYLRQSPLPTPEGEDGKNEQRHRFADVGVIADYMRAGGKGDEFYHFHTAHENTKPTEKPKGRAERMIFSIDSVGGPVQDFMDPPAQHANPFPGPTDPVPEEILVGQVDSDPEMFLAGQVNGELVWNSVFGDVAPSPGYEKLAVVGLFPAESGEMIRIVVPQSDTPVREMSDSDWWAALDKDCGAIRGKATVLTPAEHDALANLPGEPDEQP